MTRRMLLFVAAALLVATLTTTEGAAQMAKADPENTLVMDLVHGRVVIALRPDLAPKTVARIKELTREQFYDGLTFHRVIDGFMAQGGDPRGTGTGGSGQSIPDEFSDEPHVRGTMSMANAGYSGSQDSQFFICFAPAPFLDGKYTVFGQVIDGMEFVDRIKRGAGRNGEVSDPDQILRLQVMADMDG